MFKEIRLRTTSKVTDIPFPWESDRVPFLILSEDTSRISQAKTKTQKQNALNSLGRNDVLLAAWPGVYSQDIFLVDDLTQPKRALGILKTHDYNLKDIGPEDKVYVDGKISEVDSVTHRRNGQTQVTLPNGRTFHSNSSKSLPVVI